MACVDCPGVVYGTITKKPLNTLVTNSSLTLTVLTNNTIAGVFPPSFMPAASLSIGSFQVIAQSSTPILAEASKPASGTARLWAPQTSAFASTIGACALHGLKPRS